MKIRCTDSQLVGKPIQPRTFLITRSISLKKELNSASGKKKTIKKSLHGSKTVMLINSVLMTTLIFYMWRYKWYIYSVRWICIFHVLESEKILVFHRQPYYRYSYHISRMLQYQKKRRNCVFFFSTSSFVSNFVCFWEIFASFDFEKSYNYIQHVIKLCHMLITRFSRITITYI